MKTIKIARDKKLQEMCDEHKASTHHIDKKSVNLKAAEGAAGSTGELGGTFVPSDEELAKINEFTKVTATADNVVAFPLMSCNDMYDRDDERFTPDTIPAFASLEPPFSFTGKSFMADHDYQMAKVRGRIFDTDTAADGDVNFLTNKVYVPKTQQYADYIENLDFGLAWAVSVGVVVDKALCSICDSPVYTSRFMGMSWCAEGHDKGYFYVPGEEETDGWGYFVPCDPDTPGAVKAQVDLSDPIDGYEISQVILGAQYNAQLGKNPALKAIVKSATMLNVPIIGLSRKDVEETELPIPTEDDVVSSARQQYEVTSDSDGDPTWTDDDGLVWVYTINNDTNNFEVMCLGRKETSDGEGEGEQGGPGSGEELRADGEGEPEGDDATDPAAGDLTGEEPGSPPGGADADAGQREDLSPDDDKEKHVSKKSLLAALKVAKFPTSLIDKVEEIEGDNLPNLLGVVAAHLSEQDNTIATMQPMADMGEQYRKDLRAEAIGWYVKAHATDPNKPVSTTQFEKILDAVEGDVAVLKTLIEENKAVAKAKFPNATLQSAHAVDPSTVEPSDDEALEGSVVQRDTNRQFAERIHR